MFLEKILFILLLLVYCFIVYNYSNNSIILYDAAYEAFITEEGIPHTIYEIDGAKEVAIEFKSYSKTAGFTGVRCAYVVIPKELKGKTKDGEEVSYNKLWNRRTCTKFNGVSYIVQKAAEATYSEEGRKQIQENINYYLENARIIKQGLEKAGFTCYGGVNSPYVWLKVPDGMTSWEFFDELLEKAKANDKTAIKTIVEHNIRLVLYEVTNRFKSVEYDRKDLVSVGNVGLMKAILTFDRSRNVEFATYAIRCIDNEILIFLRDVAKNQNVDSLERAIKQDKEGNELKIEDTIMTNIFSV